jgi:hypothetical protein
VRHHTRILLSIAVLQTVPLHVYCTVPTEIGFRVLHFACSHRTVFERGAYRSGLSARHGALS